MASSFCNAQILPFNSSTKKAVSRVVMVQSKDVTPKRIYNFNVRLIAENKVYADPESGIVCYRGEDGKVVCEGLDEGPRHQIPETRTFADRKSGNMSGRGRIHEDPWNQLPERTGFADHRRELQILASLDARFS
ncbi:hypothetical protein EJ110_NYTH49946 [Nymphaea thermarum]|nr:hypothetical protein EJ110_NYTH49946 [Nymphaea thermarum]